MIIPGIYNFTNKHIDKLTHYLSENVPIDSVIHYGKNHLFHIKYGIVGNSIEISTMRESNYNKMLVKDYPYSYQTHVIVYSNDKIESADTGKYGNRNGREIYEYLLEFYSIEVRDSKIENILK